MPSFSPLTSGKQLLGAAVGGSNQGLGEANGHLAADTGLCQGVQQGQTSEVAGNMACTYETREDFFQDGEVHFFLLIATIQNKSGEWRSGRTVHDDFKIRYEIAPT